MNEQKLTVVLIRHAQSQWNLENRFSGWADPPLTDVGQAEAIQAAESLKNAGFGFDIAFCSRLQRAKVTMNLVLKALGQENIPQIEDWRLNERHYGQLQGKIKDAATNHTTEEQIWRWRRSYLDKASPLSVDDDRHPIHSDLYRDVPEERLPAVENLAETRVRVAEFWQESVVPRLNEGLRIFISSHGNTLRALLMELSAMEVQEVEGFEIPTGKPILVDYDHHGKFLHWHYLNMR